MVAMTTKVRVSRLFEPVPHMRVEARYTFVWSNGGLKEINLSQRKDPEVGPSRQFAKTEEVEISDVPPDIAKEAEDRLSSYAEGLREKRPAAIETSDQGGTS